eukprot:351362-Chlamydomonas_euryale.AAC.4
MPTLVPVPVRARVRRYDSSSGTFELVPVHSMPDNILINAAAAVPPAPPHTRGGVAAQSRLWVGFNVEDAATHVKLVSKVGVAPRAARDSQAAQATGRPCMQSHPACAFLRNGIAPRFSHLTRCSLGQDVRVPVLPCMHVCMCARACCQYSHACLAHLHCRKPRRLTATTTGEASSRVPRRAPLRTMLPCGRLSPAAQLSRA